MRYYNLMTILLLVICSLLAGTEILSGQPVKELKRHAVGDEIRLQAVSVDKKYIYAIGNSSIIKYDKKDFTKISEWSEKPGGSITHLNSGVIMNGKLYCAHSNFPESPMLSSIEVFSTKTLRHIGSHSFGFAGGSATWVDKRDGYWWVAFANYNGKRMSEDRDNTWTKLVKFSKDWKQIESWSFPQDILISFGLYSNSGGLWYNSDELYITGHDLPEIYVVKLPKSGSTLKYVRTIQTISEGQGIAIEKLRGESILYGISKKDQSIIIQKF